MTTLLVINDDPVQLHLLASLLEAEHQHVISFSCSATAWQWLQEGHVPDGIVLDLHMPGMNGWQFCELLHTQGIPGEDKAPPVLIVSATYSGKDAENLLADIGASAFLALPAEPSSIRQQVQRLLQEPMAPKGFLAWIVSSNNSTIKRIRSTFVERGWQVQGWRSGKEMQTASGLAVPDIIIIDDSVLDSSTHALLAWCKKACAHSLCLVLGQPEEERECSSLANRSEVYLPKECSSQSLVALCEKWRWERALTRVEHLLEKRTNDLTESAAQFRSLFEILPDILVIYDKQYVIQHINADGAQQLGYSSHELIGMPLVKLLFHPPGFSFDGHQIHTEQRSKKWQETILQKKDGVELSVEMLERNVLFQGDEQTLVVARDTSDRKHMAQENAILEQQLRQVQKMEAVGRLASGVAHDMNNILTAILAHAGLLKMRVDGSNPLWKAGDVIAKAVHRGKELTSQLLGFARQGKHHHLPVDVHSVIQEVTGLLGRTVDKTIRIHTDLWAEEPWVVGDPNQLYQVLMNLAVNASHAMSDKGELNFRTSNDRVSSVQASTIPGMVAGDYLVVRVTDTGEGMSQEVQAHIFEPFFTTKEKGQGSGMGLAMAYGIVKNHHGYIEVTSQIGVGTTMGVYLPFVSCEQSPSMLEEGVGPSVGTGTVLIVDDERAVAEAAQAILEFLGYVTTICLNGQEAIAYAKKMSNPVDLVLLDMVMPDMSGPECFFEFRKIRPESKVVLCTGFDRNHAVQDLLNQGVVGFIQKPYDLDELARVCADALQESVPVETC